MPIRVPERLHVTADESRVHPDFLGLYEIQDAKVNGKAMWQKVEGADSHGVDRFISSSPRGNWRFHTASSTGTDKASIGAWPKTIIAEAKMIGMMSPHEFDGCWETYDKSNWVMSPTLRVRRVDPAPQIDGLRISADDDEELHTSVKAVLGNYVAIPNRRVAQLRSGRPDQMACASAAVRWPRTYARWHPGLPYLGSHAGLNGWAPPLCTSGEKRERACMTHASLRLPSKPSPHHHQSSPVPTQVNGMPAFRHQLMPGTQLRFDGEWKVLWAL